MKKTQKQKVKDILLTQGYMTNQWAIDTKLTIRLGAIIKVLRDEGWDIQGDYIDGTKNWKYTLNHSPEKLKMRKEFAGYVVRDGQRFATFREVPAV